jgi:hypothetical protein
VIKAETVAVDQLNEAAGSAHGHINTLLEHLHVVLQFVAPSECYRPELNCLHSPPRCQFYTRHIHQTSRTSQQ